MRALDTLVAARQARAAIERLLEVNDWPDDPALHRAIDQTLIIEEQARAAIERAAAWRRTA
jgi:hypothetical protein